MVVPGVVVLDPFLVRVLQDPADHDVLYYVESSQVLYNPRPKVAYAINGVIPMLLPAEGREVIESKSADFDSERNVVRIGD